MLHLIDKEYLLKNTALRAGETKLGESLLTVSSLDELKDHTARFVLLGVKEDIGIRANLGVGGAVSTWDYAIKALCNVQENRFNQGKSIIVLGALRFDDLLREAEKLNNSRPDELKRLRELTAEIDSQLCEVIKNVVGAGKVPIIIGGGHNNAMGNLEGTSLALNQPLNALNIDPHTDYRAMEGRHSGNGFRYARNKGLLGKYAVWGLHQNYNGQDIIELFDNDPQLHYQSFEELLSLTESERQQRFKHLLHWLGHAPLALELDLDSVSHFPVSALNPAGFTLNEIRQIVILASSLAPICYFHLCEASPGRANTEMERELIGKSLAYLITDFVKSAR